MMSKQLCVLLLVCCFAAAAVVVSGQEIRSYTRQELFAGQICGDDGPGWEKKDIGECPQGYNGLRAWAKARGLLPGSSATTSAADKPDAFRVQKEWPYCNPCKDDQMCFEFKPGVAKCITKADSGSQFLAEGEVCLDFSNKKKKWTAPNPKMYGMSCKWPEFSCNYDAKADNGIYRWVCICVRVGVWGRGGRRGRGTRGKGSQGVDTTLLL